MKLFMFFLFVMLLVLTVAVPPNGQLLKSLDLRDKPKCSDGFYRCYLYCVFGHSSDVCFSTCQKMWCSAGAEDNAGADTIEIQPEDPATPK
ncbi:hypothetical protein N0V83_010228 [Neocucurbitaria cava]|uniref:Uncharacterized protein n=1 Tax=Neocucurbitaria cava TaxID=798079 RepID=A0A9W8XZG7_9PLEO|nr:hypothetical protein N0V83_010228 [Neocucurbitaria cava]